MNKKIIDFLKEHPLIAIAVLEKKCNVSASTIANAMAGRRGLPQKHIDKIVTELKKYGFTE